MSIIKPFKAIRPVVDKAPQVSCPPYDVVYDSEARSEIAANPLTFLRVTRPEADMAEGTNGSSAEAFERGRQNLEQFIRDGVLEQDAEDAIYVYQLSVDGQTQTGVVACCSIDEYEQGTIKKHEKTRPDKVADRTGHMIAVGAQTGLIFLAFRGTDTLRALISDAVATEPLYDFRCPVGVAQRVWRITDTAAWVTAFAEVPAIYIADGHHRAESAKLAREELSAANPNHTGSEEYNYVIAGIFPAEDLKILPYNRVVRDLNGLNKEDFIAEIGKAFTVETTTQTQPADRGDVCMYLGGEWYKLTYTGDIDRSDPINSLDVSILQEKLLTPVLGIGDPRTDTRITFVGGGRGTEELVRLVDGGEAEVAFSMYPTTMDDLFAVADIDEIMPPKSTWFEPKLKDGLLIHRI